MSESETTNGGSSGYKRKTARRVFAGEYNDATYEFKESDSDQAPNYVLLPTGQRANRVYVCGVATEIVDVADDPETKYYRARVVGKTGTFYVYAGQYQPEAEKAMADIELPQPVAVTGKTQTYTPDDEDDPETIVQIKAEAVDEIPKAGIDRWVVKTAELTLDRLKNDEASNPYVQMAKDEYDTDAADYKQVTIDALNEIDEEYQPTPKEM